MKIFCFFMDSGNLFVQLCLVDILTFDAIIIAWKPTYMISWFYRKGDMA